MGDARKQLQWPYPNLGDCCLSGRPVSGSAHIDPVTVQFKTNLGVTLRDEERFQGGWDREIEPAV
jgi:hypothetical protein